MLDFILYVSLTYLNWLHVASQLSLHNYILRAIKDNTSSLFLKEIVMHGLNY